MTPFARSWEASKLDRAYDAARSLEYWYRNRFTLPPNDPRFLNISHFQMEDEFRTHASYMRLVKGEPDETEYDSGETEDELLGALDQLGDGMPEGAAPPRSDEWDDRDPAELLKELDTL